MIWLAKSTDNSKWFAWFPRLWVNESRLYLTSSNKVTHYDRNLNSCFLSQLPCHSMLLQFVSLISFMRSISELSCSGEYFSIIIFPYMIILWNITLKPFSFQYASTYNVCLFLPCLVLSLMLSLFSLATWSGDWGAGKLDKSGSTNSSGPTKILILHVYTKVTTQQHCLSFSLFTQTNLFFSLAINFHPEPG